MDKIKISLEKSYLEEHYREKVSHKKPSKEHKTYNTDFADFKDFYIIRSKIIYCSGLFTFPRDSPPVAI